MPKQEDMINSSAGPGSGNGAAAGELAPRRSADTIELLKPVARYVFEVIYKCEWRHPERIPGSPVLVVANHNAGGIPDIFLLLHAWSSRFGTHRPLLGLAHKINFKLPVLRELAEGIGAVPADAGTARKVIGRGVDLVVFPGGDWEAARPRSQAGNIDFGGRMGFLRLALETGATISPLVFAGVHESTLIVSRGTSLARWLRLDRLFRLKSMPIGIPLPVIPARAIMESLDPIDLGLELRGIAGFEKKLAHGYELVTSRMQQKLDELEAELGHKSPRQTAMQTDQP